MSTKRRGRASNDPHRLTVALDFGGVLSAGHDPVPDIQELTGGDPAAVGEALWSHRDAYDHGAIGPREYWQHVADAAGMNDLTDQEVADLQDTDNRYFLHLDPASRALIHDLARNRMRVVLLSNASVAFGEAVRRADWFEAFGFAVVSGEEGVVKPDPEIYRIMLDVLAHETGGVTRPGDVIFFDDRQDNVEAARALGIDAHHWPRNGDPLPKGGRPGVEIAREVLTGRGIPLD